MLSGHLYFPHFYHSFPTPISMLVCLVSCHQKVPFTSCHSLHPGRSVNMGERSPGPQQGSFCPVLSSVSRPGQAPASLGSAPCPPLPLTIPASPDFGSPLPTDCPGLPHVRDWLGLRRESYELLTPSADFTCADSPQFPARLGPPNHSRTHL